MEYACQIWDDCSEGDSIRLENFQLTAARIITGAKKGTSHQSIYNETSWETLSERRKNTKLIHMHKIVNHNVPQYLSDLIPGKISECTNVNVRNKDNLRNVYCRTAKYSKSFIPSCIDLWNEIDSEITDIENIDEFKKKIRKIHRNELYCYGPRKLNVIHAQLRMNCSNLNAHLKSLHVTDDPTCICGNSIEDCFHYFLECPLYHNQRQRLNFAISDICNMNLDTLLFGNDNLDLKDNQKIFDAVQEYIMSSERFST